MQITDLLLLGLAAFVAADCDENDDNSNDCSTSSVVVSSTTTTDVNGAVITELATSTDVEASTSLVPVSTEDASTSTDVDVNTNRMTLSETTDIGTTPTNTIVQVATTTDVNLESGYAYTANSANETIATYTGTDDNAPRTTSIGTSSTSGAAAATGNANDDNNDADQTSSDSFAVATAVPYIGAAAMAGLAFAL